MTENTEITPAPKKARKIKLTKAEKAELLHRRDIELAISYFLDLEQNLTLKQIADAMGMSVSTLKRLTTEPLFQEIYDEQLMQLGHHPRLQALNAQLPELIPHSYQAMRRLLSPGTAHTAQVAAVKLLWDTMDIGSHLQEEDPAVIGNFLAAKGINIEQNNTQININLPIPEDYQEAFRRLVGAEEVVTVQATDIPTSETDEGE